MGGVKTVADVPRQQFLECSAVLRPESLVKSQAKGMVGRRHEKRCNGGVTADMPS
jgi:hypothetical protein